MPSRDEAIDQLRDVILNVLPDKNSVKAIVNSLGEGQFDHIIADGPAWQIRLRNWLAHADQAGLLGRFENKLREQLPGAPNLEQAIQNLREATGRIRGGWYAPTQPASRSFFVKDGGLLDRETLRDHIDDMVAPVGPRRLLLLRGSSGVGKTYSYKLIKLVADAEGDAFAYVNLKSWDIEDAESGGATMQDVAADIIGKLEFAQSIAADHSTVARTARNLARKLANGMRALGRRTWLFIDHLDSSSADPSVISLIRRLAFMAEEDDYDFLRLIVAGRDLDREHAFGQQLGRRGIEEVVTRFADHDIERYFHNLAEYVDIGTWSEDQVQAACDEVKSIARDDDYMLPRALWQVADKRFKPEVDND